MPECHENVKTILDKLAVDAVKFSVSADIKMSKFMINSNSNKYHFLFQC